jgi:hypothetical protein
MGEIHPFTFQVVNDREGLTLVTLITDPLWFDDFV